MLVLSRKKQESIDIDDGRIVVTVVDIRRSPDGRYVARLGITAPRAVTIHRREVSEAIAAELESVQALPQPLDLERH